jgi:hypothetical protein
LARFALPGVLVCVCLCWSVCRSLAFRSSARRWPRTRRPPHQCVLSACYRARVCIALCSPNSFVRPLSLADHHYHLVIIIVAHTRTWHVQATNAHHQQQHQPQAREARAGCQDRAARGEESSAVQCLLVVGGGVVMTDSFMLVVVCLVSAGHGPTLAATAVAGSTRSWWLL